jgi:hypothetical protein
MGIWYAYVPAGKYRIGTANRPDSKPIEVTLSGFYISEKKITHAQLVQHMEEQQKKELKKLEAALPQALPQDSRESWLILNEVISIITTVGPWFRAPSPLCQFDFLLSLLASPETSSQLTSEQRQQAMEFIASYRKRLESLRTRDTALGTESFADLGQTSHHQALEVARWAGASLPTEAQWEVAALSHAAGGLRMEGMLDDVLEWCVDYYDHDYFRRHGDFENPRGPERGRLNKEQRRAFDDSGLDIMSRFKARGFHVLRGHDLDTRFYARYGDLLPYSTGIRLVYNLER